MFKASKELKEKLRKRQITYGTWITLGHSSIAEILSSYPFDWLVVDMEHSVIDLSQAQELIQVISLSGKVPLVRLSDQNPTLIKRVMDAGAAGVLVPNVITVEEAKSAVEAVKYPPVGTRGVGLARAQAYGLDFESYKKWVNKNSIVMVQIEHVNGVKNLKKILGVPGVDGMIIGPYDLSASVDLPGDFENKKVKDLINTAVKTAVDMNITAGYHVVPPDVDEVKERIKQGFNFIGYSLDTIALGKTYSDGFTYLKETDKGEKKYGSR